MPDGDRNDREPRKRGGRAGTSQAQRRAVETLIDDIGAQSFPASDPPAWGVASTRLEEALEEALRDPPPPQPARDPL